jgi:hypothetical protein
LSRAAGEHVVKQNNPGGGIDADGYLPEFMHLTDGKFHEIKWAKKMPALPKGSFAVFDRGFNEYGWFSRLDRDGVFFVTRLKKMLMSNF